MSDRMIETQLSFNDDDGTVNIAFNHVELDDVEALFTSLGTPAGQDRFADTLIAAMRAKGIDIDLDDE